MAADILDERRFKSQCSLYESGKDSQTRPSSTTTTPILRQPSMSNIEHHRRVKYPTQSGVPTSHASTNSIHNRHSGSTDILSLIRSFALKPFKSSSMTNAIAGGQTSDVIGGANMRSKESVNLLRYRPISDVLTDHASHSQSTLAVEEFLKRMGWSNNPMSDDDKVKWNTAMKFLIPVKFDVSRAIELYQKHENLRQNEHLDRIWISNPRLIREIQSGRFFSLPQIPNRPLTIIFTISNPNSVAFNESIPAFERELITLQALICQLDVATENHEVQQNGLNFLYDMQNCSSSQLDMSLNRKILKLLQDGYHAMLKNIFVISPPKWFEKVHKVAVYSVEEIRQYLISQYGYSTDVIPRSLGGTFDPIHTGHNRYQTCLAKVSNPQSICHSYYVTDSRQKFSLTNSALHNSDFSQAEKSIVSSATTAMPSSSSSLAWMSLGGSHDTPARKRESLTPMDYDKRQRSHENLIEEEQLASARASFNLRKENLDDPLKRHENSYRSFTGQQEKTDYETKIPMNNKRETKRPIVPSLYKPLNEQEFLSRSSMDIRQEFRRLPNPPARDAHAAKEEKNLDKSRYRDVIPGESTRVKLQADIDDKHDFINANYVSGYQNQEHAYIFTQGPLQNTVKDFWRMIWQENIAIIVMTTNIREANMTKCYPYWPMKSKEILNAGIYQIENDQSEIFDSFVVTTLLFKKKNSSEIRTIYHAHYQKWPDHGVPANTKDALAFLEKVEYYKQLTETNAPILLHCSAGIGRTGTFCAIDIGIKQYLNEKTIDIPSTVIKMRQERAGSVQTEDQYLFAYLALMDFIQNQQTKISSSSSLNVSNSSDDLIEQIPSQHNNGID